MLNRLQHSLSKYNRPINTTAYKTKHFIIHTYIRTNKVKHTFIPQVMQTPSTVLRASHSQWEKIVDKIYICIAYGKTCSRLALYISQMQYSYIIVQVRHCIIANPHLPSHPLQCQELVGGKLNANRSRRI